MSEATRERVLVTRSAEDSAEWAVAIERTGARVVVYPCITTEIVDTPALRAALAAEVPAADWLVFTSRRGVEAFATLHPRPLARETRIAAVGPATGEAARARFGRADHVGAGTAAQLAASLPGLPTFGAAPRCVLALAENAPPLLERRLAAAAADCRRFDVYRTIPAGVAERKEPLSALGADKILFASPSAVEGFVNRVQIDGPVGVFTIGPSTSAAARARGIDVTAEAREPSLEGLLEAMHG